MTNLSSAGESRDDPHHISRPQRKIFISTSSVFVANLAVALLGTIALRVMTVHLGPQGYGIFVTVLAFVTSSMLLTDLGLNSLTGREISRNPGHASEILGVNAGLRIGLSLLIIPAVWAAGHWTYGGHVHSNDITLGILIVSLAIPFDAVRALSLAYFVSRIENHRTAIINLVSQVAFVSFTIAALSLGSGVIGCFWAYFAATVISSGVAFYYASSRVRIRPIVSFPRWWKVMRQSVSIGLIQVSNVVYVKVATILASLWLASREVAIYGVATAIIAFFLVIPMMYSTSLLPLMTKAGRETLPKLVQRSVSHMSIVGSLIASGCICTGAGVIYLLAGPKFNESATPLSILSVAIILTGLTSVFGYANFSQDRHHRMLIVSFTGLALNVSLNFYAIPRHGIIGASVVMIASEFVMLVGTYIVFRARVGHRISVVPHLIRPVIAGVVTCLVMRLGIHLDRTNPLETVLGILAVLAIFVATLGAIGGWPPEILTKLRRSSSDAT